MAEAAPSALASQATDLATRGEYASAAALFARAAAAALQPPPDPYAAALAHEARAQCLLEAGEVSGAQLAARAALALRPAWAEAHLTAARAALNGADFDDAVASFERALALDPALAAEVGDDLPRSRRLRLARDEKALHVDGACLRVQQWLAPRAGEAAVGEDGMLEGCAHCARRAEPAPTTGAEGFAPRQPAAPVPAATPLAGACASADPCEAGAVEGEGPGARVWEAGAVLAMWLEHSRPPLRGVRALELGSGTGVVGLAAAALGARVTLTDRAPIAHGPLRANVRLNAELLEACGGSATAEALDWDDPAACERARALAARGGAQLLLAADVTHGARALLPLGRLVRAVLDAAAGASGACDAGDADVAASARTVDAAPAEPRTAGVLTVCTRQPQLWLAHRLRGAPADAALEAEWSRLGLALSAVPTSAQHPQFRTPRVAIFVVTATPVSASADASIWRTRI